MLPRKGQPVRHTASQAPKSRHRRRLPSGTAPWRTFGQAKKNSAPETRDGRSFKAGWRIASAGVINRHRYLCCKITLRLFHRCDSPVTIPGIWHCTHVAAAGKAARPHHPATKAACRTVNVRAGHADERVRQRLQYGGGLPHTAAAQGSYPIPTRWLQAVSRRCRRRRG